MNRHFMRAGLVASTLSLTLLAAPSESQALGFQWLKNLFGCCHQRPQVAYYGGMCDPCGPQTVQYVPQTTYRVQYVSAPVTTYRPVVTYRAVTGADPCTGCPVTTYRPVTAMQPVTCCAQRAQLVPQTSYRLVYSNPAQAVQTVSYAAPSSCGCGTMPAATTTYAPATTATYYAPSTVAPATTTTTTPTTTYYQQAPSTTITPAPATTYTPVPTTTYSPAPATVYTPAPSTVTYPPATTEGNGQANGDNADNGSTGEESEQGQSRLKPIPDANADSPQLNNTSAPALISPDDQTTSLPGWSYSTVAWRASEVEPAGYSKAVESQGLAGSIDASGWRASNR